MTGLGNLLYFILIFALIGAICAAGITIGGLIWLFEHVSIVLL